MKFVEHSFSLLDWTFYQRSKESLRRVVAGVQQSGEDQGFGWELTAHGRKIPRFAGPLNLDHYTPQILLQPLIGEPSQ